MSKFKVGDRVKVTNPICDYYDTVGEVTEIDRISRQENDFDFRVDFKTVWLPYDAWELELVAPEVVTEKYGLKVGEKYSLPDYPECPEFTILAFDFHGFDIVTSRSDGNGGCALEPYFPGKAPFGFDSYRAPQFRKIETPKVAPQEPQVAFIVMPAYEFEQYGRMTKEAAEAEAKEYAESDEIAYVVLQVGSKFAHVSQVVETPITL